MVRSVRGSMNSRAAVTRMHNNTGPTLPFSLQTLAGRQTKSSCTNKHTGERGWFSTTAEHTALGRASKCASPTHQIFSNFKLLVLTDNRNPNSVGYRPRGACGERHREEVAGLA